MLYSFFFFIDSSATIWQTWTLIYSWNSLLCGFNDTTLCKEFQRFAFEISGHYIFFHQLWNVGVSKGFIPKPVNTFLRCLHCNLATPNNNSKVTSNVFSPNLHIPDCVSHKHIKYDVCLLAKPVLPPCIFFQDTSIHLLTCARNLRINLSNNSYPFPYRALSPIKSIS